MSSGYRGTMRWRSGLVAGAVLLSLSVTGCATKTARGDREGAAEATGSVGAQPAADAGDAAARAQAQAWLDAAALPAALDAVTRALEATTA